MAAGRVLEHDRRPGVVGNVSIPHLGGTTAEARIVDPAGGLVAHCTTTCLVVRPGAA